MKPVKHLGGIIDKYHRTMGMLGYSRMVFAILPGSSNNSRNSAGEPRVFYIEF